MEEYDDMIESVFDKNAPDFLNTEPWQETDIEGDILDFDDEIQMPDFTLRINGSKCAPVGEIQCVTGQSGHGKTMTMAMLMGAYLGDTSHNMEYIPNEGRENPTILYIDTEMAKGNTQLVVKRVSYVSGISMHELKGRLNVIRLRDETTAEARWLKILHAINAFKPTVVFLDGMIDVIGDFNDNKNSQTLIFKCMALTTYYKIALWMVIHQNPGTTKMVGHEGSFIERKSSDILATIKEKDASGRVTFTLKQLKARSKDFNEYTYHVEETGDYVGYPVIDKVPEKEEPKVIDREAFLRATITAQSGITTSDLLNAIKRTFGIGTTKAQSILWEMEADKLITRDSRKSYHLADILATQTEVPY